MSSRSLGMSSEARGMHSQRSGMDSEALGMYSEGLGIDSERRGMYSQALGIYSERPGINSQALGIHSQAPGAYSEASGAHLPCLGGPFQGARRGFLAAQGTSRSVAAVRRAARKGASSQPRSGSAEDRCPRPPPQRSPSGTPEFQAAPESTSLSRHTALARTALSNSRIYHRLPERASRLGSRKRTHD